MIRNIEILAPAGSYDGMRAAMNAGCDAVYIGGSSFGARAYADNPSEDLLLRAIDEAHVRDKKLYLTVNTLLKEKELTGQLYSFLEKYYRQGLDAVIVQDVGVMRFIHKNFPELPIHASTQMTLTMAQGANLLKADGVTRLVTSRELSFREIREIRENTDLEIETFVHGALCYCYSGQCLMSSIIGGRSGNRGRCAQPCRMPYQFYQEGKRISKEQEKYLLSPKDINTIETIPELIEAGVDSFKIEGRMKRPEYAAAVSAMYHKYINKYFELGKDKYKELFRESEYQQDMLQLLDVYNRGGFSGGYGSTYHGKSMMSLYRPNHSGVYVGTVDSVKGSKVYLRLTEDIHAQDILEIRLKEEEGYEFTVKDSHPAGAVLETNVGIRRDNKNNEVKHPPVIHVGTAVYRTRNNELLEALNRNYLSEDKKLGVCGYLKARQGEKLALTISYKDFSVTAYQDLVQEAIRQPMTKEKLTSPILKTGETLYYFEELNVDMDEQIFVPVAWLNELRRDAIAKLELAVIGHYRRSTDTNNVEDNSNTRDVVKQAGSFVEPFSVKASSNPVEIGMVITVQTEDQFEVALSCPEVKQIFLEYDCFQTKKLHNLAAKAGEAGKSFYLTLPYISRYSVYQSLEKELDGIIEDKRISGFLVKNFEEIALLQTLMMNSKIEKEIILDYNMYIYNKEAKSFWREKGITHYTAPVELNYQELKQLGLEFCDMLVYGYLPVMISTQCLLESTSGCNKCNENHSGILTDRLGKNFFVRTNCASCYNVIYNGQALSLHKQADEIKGLKPSNIRLDFTTEAPDQMRTILRKFTDIYCYNRNSTGDLTDYTTGHFKRGVE